MPLLCPNKCKVDLMHYMKICPECQSKLTLKKVACKYPSERCGYRNSDNTCHPMSYFDLFTCTFDLQPQKKVRKHRKRRRSKKDK